MYIKMLRSIEVEEKKKEYIYIKKKKEERKFKDVKIDGI
jgi:hypothetical protein